MMNWPLVAVRSFISIDDIFMVSFRNCNTICLLNHEHYLADQERSLLRRVGRLLFVSNSVHYNLLRTDVR